MKKISIITGTLVAGIIAFSSFTSVPAGHRGVVVQLGAVQDKVLNEGFHVIVPFIQKVEHVEVRVQKVGSSQTAASKDLQNITTSVSVNLSVDPARVNNLYQGVGTEFESRVVQPAISETVKAVTAKYTAEELITKRPIVSAEIKELLAAKVGVYNIKIADVLIEQFDFSELFNQSIEAKQMAEQNAIKAKRDLERIKTEAEQKVAQANAEAESLKLKKQEVTPELVDLKKIEVQEKSLEIQSEAIKKWNGVLPSVTGESTPFIDVSGYTK